jgi:23S rRNA pseudouridine1911/1915/1917 synthase
MAKKEAIEIIYQDADIIVINKPTGLSVTKDRSHYEELLPTLRKQLKLTTNEHELTPIKLAAEDTENAEKNNLTTYYTDSTDLKKSEIGNLKSKITDKLLLVHRLDKETSGVMMLAKNTAAQRKFTGYFAKGVIKKMYLALVSGAVTSEEGIIDAPIGNDRKDPRRMCIDFSRRGRKAVTNWRLLADFGGVALLAVSPITGRTHQIRVHLPSAGMPLTIDSLYGNREGLMLSSFKADYHLGKWQEEKPLIDRLTLHAYSLLVPRSSLLANQKPETSNQQQVFVAKLDKKFTATLKMLAKHNPRGFAAFKNPDTLKTILEAKPLL